MDSFMQQKHVDFWRHCVFKSEEQQNLAWFWDFKGLFNKIPDKAKGREVGDVHNHMRVGDPHRFQDAYPIIKDVRDRQQAINTQRCESKELLHFYFLLRDSSCTIQTDHCYLQVRCYPFINVFIKCLF